MLASLLYAASWQEVALTALNIMQAMFLAWLAFKQAEVKRDLRTYNGRIENKIDNVPADVLTQAQPAAENLGRKVDEMHETIMQAATRRASGNPLYGPPERE